MPLRRLVRHLPPLAWRDAKMRLWRDEARRLRAQLAGAAGTLAPPVPDGVDARAVIARSGLFDRGWYLSQLAGAAPPADPVRHYLQEGHRRGLSPHPCFLPGYYADQLRPHQKSWAKAKQDPPALLHYLTAGAPYGLSPHPYLDGAVHLTEHPDSASHPGGPLGHLLEHDDGQFERLARAAAVAIRDTRGFDVRRREGASFDAEAEQAFKDDLRASTPLPDPAPLVSIVLPTRDRAAMVAEAIASILAQTYPAWELLVVDDGSIDATPQELERHRGDPRVRSLRHEQSRGVAAARNTALRAATGRYVAYLDSDNTWEPDFLELMVRFLTRHGHHAAYAMSALVHSGEAGRVLYRGMGFDRAALRERNYIDCIVLVHERDLLDRTGLFDERLRRTVDWDLFIRLADECDFGFAPFVGTRYDVWDDRGDRITTEESIAYRFLVYQRTLVDWGRLEEELHRRRAGLLSAVVVAGTAEATVTTVRRAIRSATGPLEVVVLDNHLSDTESTRLHFELADLASRGVRLHRLRQPVTMEVARNVAAAVSSGEHLVFLPEAAWPEPGWDRPLVERLGSYAVVQPLVLTPGGAVRSAGLSFRPDGVATMPYRGFAGDAPEVRGTRPVDAATALCFAVRTRDFVEAEGLDPLYLRHHNGGELSLRISAVTRRPAACVGESVVGLRQDVTAHRRIANRVAGQDNERRQAALWQRLGDPGLVERDDRYAWVGPVRHADRRAEDLPLLVHARPERPLRWAIKIGAPTVEVRTHWGDWHFALALRDSLERLGHEVTIDCEREWYRASSHLDDVVLALRGVSAYEVAPSQTNLLWVISHPERVALPEVRAYDLVFGASARWCQRVSPRLPHPAEPLLQCTDVRRFRPVEPDPHRAHEVLVVANARGVRPAVAAALEAGIVPSVYGVRWEGLLPEGAWQGEYLPNEELPGVYAAAGVVLNDHWDDMREHGIVSNRLFDLVASDARVISDHLPEIEELFGDVVLTYRSPADLPRLVRTHLTESAERRQARLDLGSAVRERHSFDARARALSDAVLGLRRSAGPVREPAVASAGASPGRPGGPR